ncbi:uncharacterized protein LOC123988133 [Osmia bicornis bicornis]|uniref:uncharacterized protein LOC123988133 n=1 Tax=Osmia bicornis bicornis TaxID=1437191 RepID=UPI001EAF40FD|nr:uncharacterized protein LOC123988133 [Osmia bicornis bicornis]
MDDFYVDDLLTGAETPSEIRQLKNELSKILGQSGFPLRKWATNCQFILEEDSNLEVNKELAAEKDPKTLGLIWATKADTLQWSVSQSDTKRVTKRIILSEIARIFDPLGLVGPVIIQAKILMQRLWQLQTGWDESVSQELYLEWLRYRLELEQLVNIRVPRCTIVSKYNRIELHGFSDASQEAYGACVYLRSEINPGTWEVRLLCAKSRVAPLRSVSIPRLELCGALILVRLIKKVKESLPLTISVERYWTDSTIVIAWISSPPNKWKTFVANRVAEIQSITLIDNWSHISSLDNPADIISRGMTPSALVTSTLWWSGPTWLSRDARHWPVSGSGTTEVPEARVVKVSLAVSDLSKYSMFGKYSEYSKLLRVVAFCLRFIDRIRNNASLTGEATQNRLSCLEINRARVTIIKLVQEETFHDELIELKKGEMVSKRSCLYSLSPFLDEGGLIRVGGRHVNAPVKYDKRHPIVLPAKHSFSDLVESCLNSRPISPLSMDPHDTNPLTPGHFLIGDALCALPDTDLRDVAVNRLNRYQLIQQMFQHFWQRWHKEYLHQMQQKWKWRTTSQQQPAEGTLVIIKEDNSPPLRWCLGRVVQTHKGRDGVIRVVTVRTADATYKRPITKICILPIEDNLKQNHGPT